MKNKIEQLRKEKNIVSSLAENPYTQSNVIKLSGYENLYRARIGRYRILYKILDDKLIVYVSDIESRGQVYKNI
ncbi:type II toxin-antitoxin system RelE/ParE family toxin [Bacillus sp. IITD106]|nr:type II toxin-antitoxin system RelE/ParE family toxin [Bacillus sp. IITD106]